MKAYAVTVTPKVIAYAGTCRLGAYTVTIHAVTRADAIKKARRQRLAEEGRFAPSATYTAVPTGAQQ